MLRGPGKNPARGPAVRGGEAGGGRGGSGEERGEGGRDQPSGGPPEDGGVVNTEAEESEASLART